jgi:hypothetical protein
MKQSLKIVALLMSCSLAACGNERPEIHFKPIAIPTERMDCATLITRPAVPPAHEIDWETISKAPDKEFAIRLAKLEVDKLKYSQVQRDAVVANYIVNIEGITFGCANDAQWLREYSKEQAE